MQYFELFFKEVINRILPLTALDSGMIISNFVTLKQPRIKNYELCLLIEMAGQKFSNPLIRSLFTKSLAIN